MKACNLIKQEESQREIFRQTTKEETGIMAIYGKKGDLKCSNCGKTGHTVEKCWGCKVCGKSGHTMEDCWFVKGFPDRSDRGKGKNAMNRPQYYKTRKEQPKIKVLESIRSGIKANKVGRKWQQIAVRAAAQNAAFLVKRERCWASKARNGAVPEKVMLIPNFEDNLLSIQKLSKESNCQVVFQPQYCLIQHRETKEVKGI
ncbi:Gag polyprotein [Bienertia sinuspersici]